MKSRDRLFIGAVVGIPFGIIGVSVTTLLTMIYNKLFY